ncbi:MAG TPA: hypothetical protein VNZ64_03770 [Candidatus Acidoferrum sp.]|jgi:hypothetical protein|nr:hypothetical protein [Candidatus Acidoferrum sp.]
MIDSKLPKQPAGTKPELKDYTRELPMFDLGEAIKLITEIHEKALETATMDKVAKECGYSGPSSTPFYRRVVACRLFKLLAQEGASLTPQALDYLKPDTEDAKASALNNSILGITTYNELVESHQGKRLNVEIIANGLARKFELTQPGATICAKAFVASLKFAGFLDVDGSLKRILASVAKERSEEPWLNGDDRNVNKDAEKQTDRRSYTLVLDEKRSIIVSAPLSIKQSELKRLQDWLALQLLVVPDQSTNPDKPNV